MQPMPVPPVPPASAPIETVYVKPVKPVEKWLILFIAEVAAAVLALIFLFHNAAKLFEASKIGERYFVAAANGDWREAYRMLEVEESGFIKLVFEAHSRMLIGAQMICPRATDMIGELATAIANGLTARHLMFAMRAHPTFNEGIAEAIRNIEE